MVRLGLVFFINFLIVVVVGSSLSPRMFAESNESKGVYINNAKTYLYTSADKRGRTYYTSRIMAFDVYLVDQVEGELMYLIDYPYKSEVRYFTGYVIFEKPLSDQTSDTLIRVFKEIPSNTENYPEYEDVSYDQLIFTGISGESPIYPEIVWLEVSYQKKVNFKLWISSKSSGVYRPFGDAVTVNTFLKRMNSINQTPEQIDGLLRGIFTKGHTKAGIELSLGKPIQITEQDTDKEVWSYECCIIQFNKSGVVQKVSY